MRNHLTLTLATLAATLALGATAHANNNELTLGSSSRTLHSASANALTTESLEGGALTYARQLPIEVIPQLAVWAEAGFAWGDATADVVECGGEERLDETGLQLAR